MRSLGNEPLRGWWRIGCIVGLAFGITAAAPAPGEAAPSGAAPSGTVKAGDRAHWLDYRVYWSGLNVASARVGLSLGRETYAAEVTMRTNGLVSVFVTWSLASASRGRIGEAGLAPVSHESASLWRGSPRTVRLAYRGDGPPEMHVEPPYEADDSRDVPEALRRGTTDLLSGVAGAIWALARQRRCAARIPVFDGRRRYDVVQEAAGPDRLEPSIFSSFRGDAFACRFRRVAIAGFPEELLDDDDAEIAGTVWYAAPIDGALPVPVRVEIEAPVGLILAHIAGACFGPAPGGGAPDVQAALEKSQAALEKATACDGDPA